MILRLLPLFALLLSPAAFAEAPPSEVLPEEVYSQREMAEHVLGHLTDALTRVDELRADATATPEARRAAGERVMQVFNHITANPDIAREIRVLLEERPELSRRIAEQLARMTQEQL